MVDLRLIFCTRLTVGLLSISLLSPSSSMRFLERGFRHQGSTSAHGVRSHCSSNARNCSNGISTSISSQSVTIKFGKINTCTLRGVYVYCNIIMLYFFLMEVSFLFTTDSSFYELVYTYENTV